MPGKSRKTGLVTIRVSKEKLEWAKGRVKARQARGEKITLSGYLGQQLAAQLKRPR